MQKKKFIKINLILIFVEIIVFSSLFSNVVIASNTKEFKISVENSDNWGITAMGLDKFIEKIENEENPTEVKVAVIDTGINVNHKVFEGRLDLNPEYAWDFANNDATLEDLEGRGTAIASVIAQSTSSNVKIIPVKVVDYASDVFFYLDELYQGLLAVVGKCDIVCFGIGVDPSVPTETQITGLTATLHNELYSKDTILMSNVGDLSKNGNIVGVQFPAFLDGFINSTGVDSDMEILSTACQGDRVDFALPGKDIKVASNTSNTSYKTVSGTEYALGYLCAAYAMTKSELRDVNSESTNEDVVELLKENCVDLGDSGKDTVYGNGFIDFRTSMFPGTEVTVTNYTKNKATVTFDSDNSSTESFTASAQEGKVSVTCSNACFVLSTSDGGENYTVLSATQSATDENTYDFEFDLAEGTEIIVAIKGDVNLNGTINGRDVTAMKNANKRSGSGLTKLELVLYNVNGVGSINGRDVTLVKNINKNNNYATW